MANYQSVIKTLIDESRKRNYFLDIINDGEEGRLVRKEEKMTDICNDATSTEMAYLTFYTPHKNARFSVFLIFGNNLSETIVDHTMTKNAEDICNSVIQHFDADFKPYTFCQ